MSDLGRNGEDLLIGHWSRVRATFFLLTVTLPLVPSATSAQSSGQGFLFKQPTFQVGVHAGYMLADAGGAVLNHARDQLTLGGRDFDASSWGVEFAVRGSERFDLALDFRFSRSDVRSEMRDWLEEGFPIEQTTTFTRIPVTVSTRFYLRDRGRAISQFAWIPAKWAPFVGAGAGIIWYRFEQNGDFVDIATCDPTGCAIVNFTLESNGWARTAHAFAGVDISISPRFLWTLEGRYALGRDRTGLSFDYDNLNLSGFQATIGVSARF